MCTSRPAQRSTSVSTCSPPPPRQPVVAIRRSLYQGNLSLVLVATVRGARGSHVRGISGLAAPRERRRRPDDRHIFIRRGWPTTAMGGLSANAGEPLCGPPFAQVEADRRCQRYRFNRRPGVRPPRPTASDDQQKRRSSCGEPVGRGVCRVKTSYLITVLRHEREGTSLCGSSPVCAPRTALADRGDLAVRHHGLVSTPGHEAASPLSTTEAVLRWP